MVLCFRIRARRALPIQHCQRTKHLHGNGKSPSLFLKILYIDNPDPNRKPLLPTFRDRPSTLHIQPQQVRLRPNLLRLRWLLPLFRRLGSYNLQLKQHPNHRCRSVLLLPKLQPKLHLLAKLPATTRRNDFQWRDLSV